MKNLFILLFGLLFCIGIQAQTPEDGNLSSTRSNIYEPLELYLTGSATEGGWDLTKIEPLPSYAPGYFKWTGKLKKGNFKFQTTRNQSWLPTVNATSANESAIGEHDLVINTNYVNDYNP